MFFPKKTKNQIKVFLFRFQNKYKQKNKEDKKMAKKENAKF